MNTFHTRLTLTQQLKITIQVQAVKQNCAFTLQIPQNDNKYRPTVTN